MMMMRIGYELFSGGLLAQLPLLKRRVKPSFPVA
jgi:hypothetical protein